MNRLNVIREIIKQVGAKQYLEIGVNKGDVLLNIEGPNKIGVDPDFKFSKYMNLKRRLGQFPAKLFEVPSDEFFAKHAEKELTNGIDVAFVDGMHTYRQALADVENCLKYLNEGGVIVMHDCNPLNEALASPVDDSITELYQAAKRGEVPGWNGCWNGDVWKAVVDLRINHDDLYVFTLDLDWGLGVVTKAKGNANPIKDISIEELKKAEYSFLESRRKELLNLQPPLYLYDFLKEHTAKVAS